MTGASRFLGWMAPVVLAGGWTVPAMADDPSDRTMTPEAIARDREMIRKMNQDQIAYVRRRDAAQAEQWRNYAQARRGEAASERQYARDRAEYQAARRRYEAEMAQWRRDVSACRAGDYSRCDR